MNLIKHVFKKHILSVLIILFAFFAGSALLPINVPTTLVFETSTTGEFERESSVLVAKIPQDISKNPPLFDIEIGPTSPEPQRKEVPLLIIVIVGVLMVVIVAYVVDIFYRRQRRKHSL